MENKAYEFTDFAFEDYEVPMPDASIYLSYYHSPVGVTNMKFGERTDRYIRMSMKCKVDIENGVHGVNVNQNVDHRAHQKIDHHGKNYSTRRVGNFFMITIASDFA
ncbi:hypothetical protein [Brevibacillus brevis]|uniref:hypothetical protein n=1 Tax=Brevibacillus brevis TaxID=1393 RepID=UPI0025A51100|nr:hypothetical protein [Brevibacillus brevis]WJQ80546.1 hypothetical protein QN310_24290 [Brevibacillus brevis]